MVRRGLGVVGTVAVVLTACGQTGSAETDRQAIIAALQRFSADFNAKDFDATCALFAEDVAMHYPGQQPVHGRDEFCAGLRERLSDPARSYHYDPPQIHEVLVDGDLATVSLTWVLTVRDAAGAVLDTVEEDGLDVLRRQPDGTWRIHISHAFTVAD
ncbi:YybH family protein [Mycolicibacterium phlei]